jgi:uncharacterized protein (TIGR02271 family)
MESAAARFPMKELAMRPSSATVIWGKDGFRGTVVPASQHEPRDAEQVVVQLESGQQIRVPTAALVPLQDGSYYVPLTQAGLEFSYRGDRPGNDTMLVVPMIAEELAVQKRVVETGKVRITKVVQEREAVVDEPLFGEEVEVERVPIERVVEGPVPVRYEDNTVIVSILEEVLVVEKRLMLKEELHIRKRRIETHQPQQVMLRHEEARIERLHNREE